MHSWIAYAKQAETSSATSCQPTAQTSNLPIPRIVCRTVDPAGRAASNAGEGLPATLVRHCLQCFSSMLPPPPPPGCGWPCHQCTSPPVSPNNPPLTLAAGLKPLLLGPEQLQAQGAVQ
jgi:hypothetical protein